MGDTLAAESCLGICRCSWNEGISERAELSPTQETTNTASRASVALYNS